MRSLCCCCVMWINLVILIPYQKKPFPMVQCKKTIYFRHLFSEIPYLWLILKIKKIQTKWDLIEIWFRVGSSMLSLCSFALKEPAEMVMLIRIPSECLPFRFFKACPTRTRLSGRTRAYCRDYASRLVSEWERPGTKDLRMLCLTHCHHDISRRKWMILQSEAFTLAQTVDKCIIKYLQSSAWLLYVSNKATWGQQWPPHHCDIKSCWLFQILSQ